MNLNEAKKNLELLAQGKKISAVSLEEARKRIIKTDPGINIAPFLEHLNNRDWEKAFKVLLIETAATPGLIEYFLPVFKYFLTKSV